MIQYITSSDNDFSGGIDARSAENQIQPSYVKDLVNGSVLEQRVRKRVGYQGYAGNLPVRVIAASSDAGTKEITFTLDTAIAINSSVNLLSVRSNPLVIYGKTNVTANPTGVMGAGTFTYSTNTGRYYSGFLNKSRKIFVSNPSPQSFVVPATEHGIASSNMFVGVVASTDPLTNSNQLIDSDSISIDESSFAITVGYTNGSPTDQPVFVYYSQQDTSAGVSYVASGTGTSVSIPAATHLLSNFNIVAQCYSDSGTALTQILPDSLTINSVGQVDITFNSSITYRVLLSAADPTQIVTQSVGPNATGLLTVSNTSSDFLFYSIYEQSGTSLSLVQPDQITHDATTQTSSIQLTNSTSLTQTYKVYYEYGQVRSNQLVVVDPLVTNSITDTHPEMTIWGLDHSEIYGATKSDRAGWVTHIDNYRRQGESRIMTALGGNLFGAYLQDELAVAYLLPTLLPSLTSVVQTNQTLGPVFWNTGDTPARTRGYVTSDNSGTNTADISAVAYDPSTSWTIYTIQLPGLLVLDSMGNPTALSSVISTTANLEDWLTVTDMSYSLHNGTFRIRQLAQASDSIQVWVENTANSSDYDDAGVAGQASIFTDQIDFTTNVDYLAGDQLLSTLFGDTNLITIQAVSGSIVVVTGITDLLALGTGLSLPAQRTSNVVPMRTVANLVRGDMISYSDVSRLVRALYINTLPDTTISLIDDGITATTITLGTGATDNFQAGMYITLVNAGTYSGSYAITSVLTTTSFTIQTLGSAGTGTGTLVGNTVNIDEQLQFQDSIGNDETFTVISRWIPIEAPDNVNNNEALTTHFNYFSSDPYSNQSFIRSTMVEDVMYLTNYNDSVLKFDGSNIYRAGLLPWQPGLFIQQDTSPTAKIVASLRSLPYTAIATGQGQLTITAATTQAIPVGVTVSLTGSTETYTISSYTNDGTNYYVQLDRALDLSVAATGTASEIGSRRYYFRLNAIDANNNNVASAVAQSQDYVVQLTSNAAVNIRLVGMPAWSVYNYDSIELEIYATKISTTAPFYRLTTLQVDFTNTVPYLDFVDTFADSDLTDLDTTVSALKGQELGTGWTEPPRAKYITSTDNRLVLANIQDYPQLDIQLVADTNITASSFVDHTLLFRKDSTDIATSTDMINRVKYQWVSDVNSVSVSGITALTVGPNIYFQVNAPAHGFTTEGQWVYLYYSVLNSTNMNNRPLTYCGWYQVLNIIDANNFQVQQNSSPLGAATAFPDKLVFADSSRFDIPILVTPDGNLGMSDGNNAFTLFQIMRRTSLAINSSMKATVLEIPGYQAFIPWLIAKAGNDILPAGRLLVRQPRTDNTVIGVALDNYTDYQVFVNSVRRTPGDKIAASTDLFPSRLLISYENYPEIIDSPTTVLDTESDSAIDVNPADGQEITGVIPFFGYSAFTSAQQTSVLIVFKTNSIYIVDITQKPLGNNPVQRLETEGLGCTAPYSLAVTKNGIMFANDSGIYVLRQNYTLQYVGRYMERNWLQNVNRNFLDLMHGHHYGIERQYKLSVPVGFPDENTGYIENSAVYVYDHTAEDEGKIGAWGRYDNHPATGWANQSQDAYFSSTSGRVFSIRRVGDSTDYRDDNQPVNFALVTRANNFTNAGIRKVVDKVVIHYRTGATNTGTVLGTSTDLSQEFRDTTPYIIPENSSTTGIDDIPGQDVVTISHSTDRRRGVYFQVQLTNGTIDEPLEIAGVDYKVGGLAEHGIQRAQQTTAKTK